MRVTRRAPGQWPAIWPPGWDGPAGCECCSLNIAWPGADPAEQRRHRAVPQQVHVIDAVRTRDHPSSQAGDLQAGVHPAPVADPDRLVHQGSQTRPLR